MTLAHVEIKPHQEMDTVVGGTTSSMSFAFFVKRMKGKHFHSLLKIEP